MPAHFRIDESEVDATYDLGACTLSRAGGYMHYHAKGGLHFFVQPSYAALYGVMSQLLDLLIANGDNDNETLNDIADAVSSVLLSPTLIFGDDNLFEKFFKMMLEHVKGLAEDAQKEPKPQDFDANADFEQTVKAAEELLETLKPYAEAGGESPAE